MLGCVGVDLALSMSRREPGCVSLYFLIASASISLGGEGGLTIWIEAETLRSAARTETMAKKRILVLNFQGRVKWRGEVGPAHAGFIKCLNRVYDPPTHRNLMP